jgi:hypothetical protein
VGPATCAACGRRFAVTQRANLHGARAGDAAHAGRAEMPSGKKRKRKKINTHKRKKRLRKNRHKKKGK